MRTQTSKNRAILHFPCAIGHFSCAISRLPWHNWSFVAYWCIFAGRRILRTEIKIQTMDHERASLISNHLLPLLGRLPEEQADRIAQALLPNTRVLHAVAGEYLEEPGPASEGRALLIPHGIAHSFVSLSANGQQYLAGTMIWPRRSLIFHPDVLLDDHPLGEYTQVLEPGPYLAIRYPVLRELLRELSLLRHGLHVQARFQARQRMLHSQLLFLGAAEKVLAFEERYPAFCVVASIRLRAMHVGLSRQTYHTCL